MAMIRNAAEGKQNVLYSFAEAFTRRDWQGDPLLERVAALVDAAQKGTVPAPLDQATAVVVRDERRLLDAEPAESFAVLAARQPALQDLAQKAGDPIWREEQDRNPPPRPQRPQGPPQPGMVDIGSGVFASESTPRMARWLAKRMVRRIDRAATADPPKDPEIQEFLASVTEMRAHDGTMAVLGRELSRLVGPRSATDDPLLRTRVALATAGEYLADVTGIHPPDLPARH